MVNSANSQDNLRKITPEMTIQEIVEKHPDLVQVLISEYGFHCVGCFASQFETLGDGAIVHGIVDEDFEEMLKYLNELAN
jgi:hydroxylamine reductase